MFDIAATLGDLSTQVKVGWTVWLAWGVVMLGWYRHARVVAPVAPAIAASHTPAPPTVSQNDAEADLNEGSPAVSGSPEQARAEHPPYAEAEQDAQGERP